MVELVGSKEVSVNCGKIRKRSLERRVRKGKVERTLGREHRQRWPRIDIPASIYKESWHSSVCHRLSRFIIPSLHQILICSAPAQNSTINNSIQHVPCSWSDTIKTRKPNKAEAEITSLPSWLRIKNIAKDKS